MKFIRQLFLVVLLLLAFDQTFGSNGQSDAPAEATSELPPGEVGQLGDLNRLLFEGNQTYPADAIRQGLRDDPDFLIESHPAAMLSEYLVNLQRRVILGYQHGGFPTANAVVTLAPNHSSIRLQLKEGPRFMSGNVKVSGAKSVPVDFLRQAITQPWPPVSQNYRQPGQPQETSTIIWEKGVPAYFDEPSLSGSQAKLSRILQEYGLFFPKLKLLVVPDPKSGLADLEVNIEDEGPTGVVSTIEVSGNKKNSLTDVLTFLHLSPGMSIDAAKIRHMEWQLWRSGRFLDFRITPRIEPAKEAQPPEIGLEIQLSEYAKVPGLLQELSREDQALLKFCDWLDNFVNRPEDMLFSLDVADFFGGPGHFEIVISQQEGFLLQLASPAKTGQKLLGLMVSGPDQIAIHLPLSSHKAIAPASGVTINSAMSITPDLSGPEEMSNLNLSASWFQRFDSDEKSGPNQAHRNVEAFRFNLTVVPVAFLIQSHQGETHCTLQGDTLELTKSNLILKVAADSGRLISLTFQGDDSRGSYFFENGALATRRQAAEAMTSKSPNSYNPQQPLTSLLNASLTELVQARLSEALSSNQGQVAAELRQWLTIQELLIAPLLELADTLLGSAPKVRCEKFKIPSTQLAPAGPGLNVAMAQIAALLFRFGNEMVPKRSWPWTIMHESIALLSGNTRYTDRELERLYHSNDLGPIGSLTLAWLMKQLKSPDIQVWAKRGLEKLDAADFRQDWQLLLAKDSPLLNTIEKMAKKLHDMSKDQQERLFLALGNETGQFLQQLSKSWPINDKNAIVEALAPALNAYWNQYLRLKVSNELQKLSLSPTEPNAAEVQGK